jgi:hypothetical protein
MLYAVSENDVTCPPEFIEPNFKESPSDKKVWANLARSGHFEMILGW